MAFSAPMELASAWDQRNHIIVSILGLNFQIWGYRLLEASARCQSPQADSRLITLPFPNHRCVVIINYLFGLHKKIDGFQDISFMLLAMRWALEPLYTRENSI